MNIGSRMKKFRTDKDITQEYVAKIVGVSKQTIAKYEAEIITNIPSDKIEKIAMALNVTPADIMGWEIESKNENEVKYVSCDRKIVMDAISELNADDFKYIEDLVKRLKK